MPQRRFWTGLIGGGLALGVGVALSLADGDWTNLARAGAVMVALGALLAAWETLASGNSMLRHLMSYFSRERLPSETLAFLLLFFGTLLWGFADLLNG